MPSVSSLGAPATHASANTSVAIALPNLIALTFRSAGQWRPASPSVGDTFIVPVADESAPLASVIVLSLLYGKGRRSGPEPFNEPRCVLVGNAVGSYCVLLPVGTLYAPVRTAGGFGIPAFRQQFWFF